MLNKKLKIFLKVLLFILSVIISIVLIMVDFIIALKYSGHYIINNNISQSYVKNELKEIGIEIPKNAEIIKIEYERPWDICEYEVTYFENGEEKTKLGSDTGRSDLETYIKENGKTYDNLVYSVVGLIVIFQIVFPIMCLIWLIKEIKKGKMKI